MKKLFLITTIILIFLLSLALTNPDKDDFHDFMRKKIKENQEKPDNKLKKLLFNIGTEAKILGMKIATKRVDYGFFSVFKNSFEIDKEEHKFTVIGFWKVVFISI